MSSEHFYFLITHHNSLFNSKKVLVLQKKSIQYFQPTWKGLQFEEAESQIFLRWYPDIINGNLHFFFFFGNSSQKLLTKRIVHRNILIVCLTKLESWVFWQMNWTLLTLVEQQQDFLRCHWLFLRDVAQAYI